MNMALSLRSICSFFRQKVDREPYFVRDYNRLVARFLDEMPLDQAMEQAVGGGDYEQGGRAMVGLLKEFGLRPGHGVLDFGCGSGRLSTELGKQFGAAVEYTGIDVVQEMLDYAAKRAPPSYRFILSPKVELPVAGCSVDFLMAMSVFTHLYARESKGYLLETFRVLRPGGVAIITTLTLSLYLRGLPSKILGRQPHVNSYFRRSSFERWAESCGFSIELFKSELFGHNIFILKRSMAGRYAAVNSH